MCQSLIIRRTLIPAAHLLLPLILLLAPLLSAAQTGPAAAEPAKESRIRVAAAPCPPFVISENGELSGLGVFLWQQVAAQIGLQYELYELPLSDMLNSISESRALSPTRTDVGISCLSITAEREKLIDFSHSFHETYTGIAVREHTFMDMLRGFFGSAAIWRALAIVIGVAALVGGVLYLLERRRTPKLYSSETRPGRLAEAFIVGLMFVTQGPIKFYEFSTMTARVLAAVLALSSTFLIAAITAILASAFTLDAMRSNVTGLQDLNNVRVAALQDSTSSKFLQDNGIPHLRKPDLEEMMRELDAGQLDAVVSDAAFLRYTILEGRKQGIYDRLSVLPYKFDNQNYGFAMQPASELDEAVNQALLVVRRTPAWRNEVRKYLGE